MVVTSLWLCYVYIQQHPSVRHRNTRILIPNDNTLSTIRYNTRRYREKRQSITDECLIFLHQNASEPHKEHSFLKYPIDMIDDTEYIAASETCNEFVWSRGYMLTGPISEEERNFPLAYIITAHKNAEQVERLLRAIYQPQNVYCIHYDSKSDLSFQEALHSVAKCLHNVFIASKLERVVYASFTRLKADVNCMHDLIKSPINWKYLINLAGQEFPIKRNRFIVNFLKNLNFPGHGITSVQPQSEDRYSRFQWVFEVPANNSKVKSGYLLKPVITNIPKSPPPENVTIYSGSAYNYFPRDFVNFTLNDPLARSLLTWMNDTYSPDENYWATLIRLPSAPGHYVRHRWTPRYRASKWEGLQNHPPCQGFHQRGSCVYGVGDLSWLIEHPALFANKFDIAFDEKVINCLEQWLIQPTTLDNIRL